MSLTGRSPSWSQAKTGLQGRNLEVGAEAKTMEKHNCNLQAGSPGLPFKKSPGCLPREHLQRDDFSLIS